MVKLRARCLLIGKVLYTQSIRLLHGVNGTRAKANKSTAKHLGLKTIVLRLKISLFPLRKGSSH